MEKEEGEMSDDNAMIVDDEKELTTELQTHSTVIFKAEKNGIFVEQLEKIDASKLEERAKRFGLNLTGNKLITQSQIDELYAKAGIESGNERHFRFDTLHLNGIEGLTTRELFDYLEAYKPVSMENIDELSCNIVCQDHISAAVALLVHSREIKNETLKKILAEKSHHHWREAMPHPKKSLILMRFATNGDKKMTKLKKDIVKQPLEYNDQNMDSISKNPWGDLCKSWGVYDHQEVFQRKLPKNDYEDDIDEPTRKIQIQNTQLAKRLGKRRHTIQDSEDSTSDSEWKRKTKTPRMRMHADDEESKQKAKMNASKHADSEIDDYRFIVEKDKFAPLSIEVRNSSSSSTPREFKKLSDKFKTSVHSKKHGVQSRLGIKVIEPADDSWSSDNSVDYWDHYVSSRVQKVNSTSHSKSSVWDRLETQDIVSNTQNDLRQMLKSRKEKKTDDLRHRISKSKKSNLRIEIDNN